MKKIMMLFMAALFLFSLGGQAMAYFEDGHLIRVVYDRGGTYEVVTDLGAGWHLTSPSTAQQLFNTNNFSLGQLGISEWNDAYVAYFTVTTYSPIEGTENRVWTSGPQAGQTSMGRQYDAFLGNAHYITGMNFQSGAAQNVNLQADPNSYKTRFGTAGRFGGFLTSPGTGDQNLADLATQGYVDQWIYYYGTPNSVASGLQVYNIRTYANGTTEINGGGSEPTEYTLNVNIDPQGSGTVAGDGISCPGTCSDTYDENTQVTLTAAANSGYTFSNWAGCNVANGNTCTVTLDADKTVTASFAISQPAERTLTVASTNPNSGIDITASPNDNGGQGNGSTQFQRTYDNNTQVTLTAPATANNNNFQNWTGCNVASGTTCNVTMDNNKTVTANYETPAVIERILTVASANPASGVEITVSPNDKGGQGNGSTQFQRTYDNNTQVTLTAPATAGGNTFQNWSGCASTSGTVCNVTLDAAKTVTASYAPQNLNGPDLTGSWIALDQQCKSSSKGQKCTIKGTFELRNTGNESAATTSVRYYLSDDNIYQGADTPLKELKTGTVKAGKSKKQNLSFNFAPGISATNKYIIAVIDENNAIAETNESNNAVMEGPVLPPDLTGSWLSMEQLYCKNTSKGIKCKIKGKFNIQNVGSQNADSIVRFFLSDDGAFDGGDTLSKEIKTGTIKPNQSKDKNITIEYIMPEGGDASGKHVIAVIDPDNAIVEGNEDNNVVVTGQLP